ncbi:MAG: methionine biosynthesis protein MetW [Actinobacteria bacterium]|nr:MAG: methionine biosynthesis protein MetW [Actinomycetota bacterium]
MKRIDYQIISNLIEEGSRVLDLGCGSGELLSQLTEEKKVVGEGVEIDDEKIQECFKKGLVVHHGNIDEGLPDYPGNSFDYVILSQTLQVTHNPLLVVNEMLRVGKQAIVSFPNFGHYAMRLQLMVYGRMPVTKAFPYQWYDTPNIRHTTIKDFKAFCEQNDFQIQEITYLKDFGSKISPLLINWRARLAIAVLIKGDTAGMRVKR